MRARPALLLAALLAPAALDPAVADHAPATGTRSLGGATVPMPDVLATLEAESFVTLTSGRRADDLEASGGAVWIFDGYGAISTPVDLARAGVVWLEIRARGVHPPGPKNPHLHAGFDGTDQAEWDLGDEWFVYRQSVPLLEGRHDLQVSNFNNYHAPAAARTILVDWVRLREPTLTGVPVAKGNAPLVVDGGELHTTGSGRLERNPEARGGTEWHMWGNGCGMEAVVLEEPGLYEFAARVRGTEGQGIGTRTTLAVDGLPLERLFVGKAWAEPAATFRAGPGVHVLEACYDNDGGGHGKRRLWTDEFRITRLAPLDEAGAVPPWPSAHGGLANSRSAPSALTPETARTARTAWRYDAGAEVTGTPVHADGVAYFGDWKGRIHAVRLSDGRALWVAEGGAPIEASLALDGTRLYAGDASGHLSAWDKAKGARVWRVRADEANATHLYGSPVAHGDRVCTGVASHQTHASYTGPLSFRGSVACFEAATGNLAWKTHFQPPGAKGASAWSTPAIDPDLKLLYIGTGNAYGAPAGDLSDAIAALRLENGAIAWKFQALSDDTYDNRGSRGPDEDFGASPLLFNAGGRALVGDGNKGGRFYALDRRTGDLVWSAEVDYRSPGSAVTDNEGFIGTAAAGPGAIFAPTANRSRLHALDATTGRILWVKDLDPQPQRFTERTFGSATHSGGVVIQGNAFGRVYLLNAGTGETLAVLSADGAVHAGASLAGWRILVPHAGPRLWSGKGGITAFELDRGDWRAPVSTANGAKFAPPTSFPQAPTTTTPTTPTSPPPASPPGPTGTPLETAPRATPDPGTPRTVPAAEATGVLAAIALALTRTRRKRRRANRNR